VITQYMKKYQPEMYLKNLEMDKAIKESWIKSLRAANAKPVSAPEEKKTEEN